MVDTHLVVTARLSQLYAAREIANPAREAAAKKAENKAKKMEDINEDDEDEDMETEEKGERACLRAHTAC